MGDEGALCDSGPDNKSAAGTSDCEDNMCDTAKESPVGAGAGGEKSGVSLGGTDTGKGGGSEDELGAFFFFLSGWLLTTPVWERNVGFWPGTVLP